MVFSTSLTFLEGYSHVTIIYIIAIKTDKR